MSSAARLPFNKRTRESHLHYRDLPDSIDATLRPGSSHATSQGLRSAQIAPEAREVRANGHDAQREAAIGQREAFMKQPVALVSRQTLRSLGFNEIRRQCRLKFPRYTRREINQLARELHERAWKNRDKEAVARVING